MAAGGSFFNAPDFLRPAGYSSDSEMAAALGAGGYSSMDEMDVTYGLSAADAPSGGETHALPFDFAGVSAVVSSEGETHTTPSHLDPTPLLMDPAGDLAEHFPDILGDNDDSAAARLVLDVGRT